MNQVVNEHSYFHQQIHTYLDGAMSQQEAEDFLNKVNANPAQLEKLEAEIAFRKAIKEKFQPKAASNALIQSIRSKVHQTAKTAS